MTLFAILDFFKDIKLTDVIDLLLVGFLFFELYRWLKGTAAMRVVWLVVGIFIVWKLAILCHLPLLSAISSKVINIGLIALIVIFQPEVRKFLLYIGNRRFLKIIGGKFHKRFNQKDYNEEINSIVRACRRMSNSKTGALIILARETPMQDVVETGEKLDALVSRDLLENIFFKNSPLHDGGVIIKDNRIVAARCILPVSKREDLPTDLGLRHRSAIGVTSMTDAIAIVVSEQTGQISLCKDGNIIRDLSPLVLEQMLKEELNAPQMAESVKKN